MKISTNKKELKDLGACAVGYKVFIDAHKNKDATLSQCLESNGWDDVWWLISKTYEQFNNDQKVDLRLLACDYALSTIDNFEKEYPDDDRPRKAIEASLAFVKGEISQEDLDTARSSASSAAWSAASSAARSSAWSSESSAARSAARSAESSAAWSAESSAAWSAESSAAWSAESSARSAETKNNTKMLNDLFLKWELL